jgi:enamine deaminase RidA (YjgF/YER057c/UK114 family)
LLTAELEKAVEQAKSLAESYVKANIVPYLEEIKEKAEKAIAAGIDFAEKQLAKAYEELLTYLNENKLPAPAFVGTSCVTCTDTNLFITTGDIFAFNAQTYNQANEARGYLATWTNAKGEQELYLLP